MSTFRVYVRHEDASCILLVTPETTLDELCEAAQKKLRHPVLCDLVLRSVPEACGPYWHPTITEIELVRPDDFLGLGAPRKPAEPGSDPEDDVPLRSRKRAAPANAAVQPRRKVIVLDESDDDPGDAKSDDGRDGGATPPFGMSDKDDESDKDDKSDDNESKSDDDGFESDDDGIESDDESDDDGSESDGIESDGSESDASRQGTPGRIAAQALGCGQRAPKTGRPTLRAIFVDPPPRAAADLSYVSDGVMRRIKSALELATHLQTPEHEAAAAMRTAERLLRKHNLSQADLGTDVAAEDTGVSKVDIQYTSSGRAACRKDWMDQLARLCCKVFDARHFTQTRAGRCGATGTCRYGMYGLRENAYTAAIAFTAAFNMMQALVAVHTVPNAEYNKAIETSKAAYTLSAKASYLDGLVAGLTKKYTKMATDAAPTDAAGESAAAVRALAVRSDAAQKRALDVAGINLKTAKARLKKPVKRMASYAQGTRDANTIDLAQDALE